MTVSVAGKVIHHNNCTYCKHRVVYKKAIQKKYELERCGLSGKDIPHPKGSLRYCEKYQQRNCSCNSCVTGVNID